MKAQPRGSDITPEQADLWVRREADSIFGYEDLLDRIDQERMKLDCDPENARMFPVAAQARRNLLDKLERQRDHLRGTFH